MCVYFDQETGTISYWSKTHGCWIAEGGWEIVREKFPGEPVAMVTVDPKRGLRLETAAWGMQPPWTTDPKFGKKNAYNARSETIALKPTFKEAFHKRRCLVPLTAFYERDLDRKIWLKATTIDEPVTVVAGVYEEPNANCPTRSVALVTTEPNETIAQVHDRMPVILPPEDWDIWLGGTPEAVTELLVPSPAANLRIEDDKPIGFSRSEKPPTLFD